MDKGLTHIALTVSDLEKSIRFYEKYASMSVAHKRSGAAWLKDGIRSFVIVLIESTDTIQPLRPDNHLGFAKGSVAEIDALAAQADKEDCLIDGPTQSGPPIGYWVYISDPSGHTIEFSFGQEVESVVG